MRRLVILVAVGLLAGCQQSSSLTGAPSTQGTESAQLSAAAPTTEPSAATPAEPVKSVVVTPAPVETVPLESPTTRPTLAGSVMLLGDIKAPGQRDLLSGQKVSDVLKTAELAVPATKLTLVLNRRCPEGCQSEMIDLDSGLKLLDAARDSVLRNGDELIVSVVPSIPAGLNRPTASALPSH